MYHHVMCHVIMSSEIAIRNCHQKLSSKLSSEIVIRNCNQKLSSEIVIKHCQRHNGPRN